MKGSINMRAGLTAMLTATVLSLGSICVAAQGAPGGQGGFQMPPEAQAKIKALQKWRDEHKNLTTLGTTLYQVEEINKDSAVKLDKAQSGKMLAILNTWKSKDTMNEDQAKTVTKQINGFLNDKQIKKMTTIKPRFGGGRMGGGPGGPGGGAGGPRPSGGAGGPGGPGGPGGAKMDPSQIVKMIPDPPKKPYNPLNPDSFYIERVKPMLKKNMDDFTSALQKQNKG